MADACLHLLEHHDGPEQVNVGTGTDVTIREIAESVASVVGYTGETEWDTTEPDGTPQKLLDVSKLAQMGGTSKIGLHEGLERTVAWYRDHVGGLRS
jgi:GDP-L-fucose synthase